MLARYVGLTESAHKVAFKIIPWIIKVFLSGKTQHFVSESINLMSRIFRLTKHINALECLKPDLDEVVMNLPTLNKIPMVLGKAFDDLCALPLCDYWLHRSIFDEKFRVSTHCHQLSVHSYIIEIELLSTILTL